LQLVEDIHASVPLSKRRIPGFAALLSYSIVIIARRRRAKNFGPKLKDFRFSDLGEGGWGGVPPEEKNLRFMDRFEKI